MKKLTCLFLLLSTIAFAQNTAVDTSKVRHDFEKLIANLNANYVYYHQKDVDLDCLKKSYGSKISGLKSNDDVLLFFEYLLNEFYDSHMHLKSNIKSSYRLYSPVYASIDGGKTFITNYWKDQIETKFNLELIDAEIVQFNGQAFNLLIEKFPTSCNNKNNKEVRTWIANKILAGRYSEPRIITLKTKSGKIETLDLDKIKIRKDPDLLPYRIIDSIGIIRINNALGDTDTKEAFKKALKNLSQTKGIILDLRNTVDGGNTDVANPIAGHFTKKKKIFQKYKNSKTQFVDYIKPQKPNYSNPLFVLVGRWTGSVGEGLASGFDGSTTGKVIGTELEKLAGATLDYKFEHFNFNYQFPYIEVLQQNNEPREKFIPKYLVECNDKVEDEFLIEAFKLIEANKND